MTSNPPVLKRGQRVMVYQDPATCVKPEGRAVLVRCEISHDGDAQEYWKVRFETDGMTALRWINLEKNHP